jgi:predicted TPR repeat methyltransferase
MTVLVRPQSAVVSAVSLAVVGASETAADPASSTAVAGRIDDYNRERPHQALKYRTPSEVRREALESTQSTA